MLDLIVGPVHQDEPEPPRSACGKNSQPANDNITGLADIIVQFFLDILWVFNDDTR